MADPTYTVAGQYGKLYIVQESEPNTTPDAASWKRIAPLKSFKPTISKNERGLTSAGSKRLIGHTGQGPIDVGFTLETEAWGDDWLDWLKYALGSATGTGVPDTNGDRLPTFSLIEEIEEGAYAYQDLLYNGCKLSAATFRKAHSADPVRISLQGRCQYAQLGQASGSPSFVGFQGTGGNPINPGSLGALPDPELPPVKYYHFREQIKYDGIAVADLPRIAGWELQVSQALVPIPGRVVGTDGQVYPVHRGFGEDSMTVALRLMVIPENLDYYKAALYNNLPIEYLDLIYTAPAGYSIPTKTVRLNVGKWETGDHSIEEAVTMEQELRSMFASVAIS